MYTYMYIYTWNHVIKLLCSLYSTYIVITYSPSLLFQEAEVKGRVVPEPLDVRTEEAVEAGEVVDGATPLDESSDSSKLSGTVNISIL